MTGKVVKAEATDLVVTISPLPPAEGRGRRVVRAALSAAVAQAVFVFVSLVQVPILIGMLGQSNYGLYVTLMTVPALLAASDLGIGLSVVTKLAGALTLVQIDKARELLSNALVLLVLSGTCLAAIGIAAVKILHLLETSASGTAPILLVVILVAVGVPAGLGVRVVAAQQRGWMASVQAVITALVGLTCILAISRLGGTVTLALCGTLGVATLVSVVFTGCVLLGLSPKVRPAFTSVSATGLKEVIRSGGLFFWLTCAAAVSYQTDILVVAHQFGTEDTATYALCAKLFAQGPMIVNFVLIPLWPALSSAIATRDGAWVRRTFWRALVVAILGNLVWATTCLIWGSRLVNLWTNGEISQLPGDIMWASAAWTVLTGLLGPLAILLNAAQVVKPQVIGATLMSCVNLPLSLVLVVHIGMSGPILGSLIAQTFVGLPFCICAARSLLRSVSEKSAEETTEQDMKLESASP